MLGVLCWLHARRVGVALSLLGATLGLIAMAKGFSLRTLDSKVFLLAARRFALGEGLYRQSDGHLPFKYAPVALVFLPFAALPLRLGCMAWGAVSALGWAHAAWRWAGALALDRVEPCLVATLALFGSFFLEAECGQSDLAMLWLLTRALGLLMTLGVGLVLVETGWGSRAASPDLLTAPFGARAPRGTRPGSAAAAAASAVR